MAKRQTLLIPSLLAWTSIVTLGTACGRLHMDVNRNVGQSRDQARQDPKTKESPSSPSPEEQNKGAGDNDEDMERDHDQDGMMGAGSDAGKKDQDTTTNHNKAPEPPEAEPPIMGEAVDCSKVPAKRQVPVGTTEELNAALAAAKAGDLIVLKDGTYKGPFKTSGAGTSKDAIALCGNAKAVLDGGKVSSGYTLYLANASYWQVYGITITNGQKGVMVDNSNYVLLDNINVYNIGDEGVHFRNNSAYGTLRNSRIRDTGKRKPDYGEGVYIGSSENNLKNDKSDYVKILNNQIGPGIAAEAIDVKEYSSHGLIEGNDIDGTGETGKNYSVSLIFIKGNDYIVRGNKGKNPLEEGMRVNVIGKGDYSGNRNLFENNTLEVNAKGYGFHIVKGTGNIVKCNNKVSAAGQGFSNVTCQP